jgi:hypothetical protein
MAPLPLVSVEEYLGTSYSPDCEYIDGVVAERNLGQFDHSSLQGVVQFTLSLRAKQWGVLFCRSCALRFGNEGIASRT